MQADAPVPQRRLLLLLTLLMAVTAALAGALTANLLSRGAMPALVAAPSPACVVAAAPPRQPDPMAALNAALGRPVVASPGLDAAPLASLLAASETPAVIAVPAAAPPPPASAAGAPVPTPTPSPALPSGYELDLGYFLVPDHAAAFAARVQERGVPVQLLPLPDASGRIWTHVRTPPFAGSAQALAGAARIERDLGIQTSLVAPATPPSNLAGANRP